MTWAEFNAAVRVHLTTHNRRQGVQTLVDALIKAGVTDLQRAVPALRNGHKSVKPPSAFSTDGYAGKGHFPVGAVVTSAYARDPEDRSVVFDYTLVSGEESVRELVAGTTGIDQRLIALNPARGEFRVVPNPKEDTSEVVLVWNGVKTDYDPTDEVPFDETAAHAVAEFVLARLARQIDHDLDLARSFAMSYAGLKRQIKSLANEANTALGS